MKAHRWKLTENGDSKVEGSLSLEPSLVARRQPTQKGNNYLGTNSWTETLYLK